MMGFLFGKPNLEWHLEFTKSNEIVEFNFSEDDIFIFYPKTISEYNKLIESVLKNNISFIESKNPYWNENGKMILDPDGFRIIISNLKIK